MVIDIRYIGGAFLALVLLLAFLSYSFNGSISEGKEALYKKREVLSKLQNLEQKWSKKSQKAELEQIYKLLDLFDVPFTKSEIRKRKVITLDLKSHNADKIIGLILNKGVAIKKLQIDKIDANTLKVAVEIL